MTTRRRGGRIRVIDGKSGADPGPADSFGADIDLSRFDPNRINFISIQHLSGGFDLLVAIDDQPAFSIPRQGSFDVKLSSLHKLHLSTGGGFVEWEAVLTVV